MFKSTIPELLLIYVYIHLKIEYFDTQIKLTPNSPKVMCTKDISVEPGLVNAEGFVTS